MQKRFRLISLSFLLFTFSIVVKSQTPTQTLRGKVTDSESKFPLIGATVSIFADSVFKGGSQTDFEGNYRIENVEVGRYNITVTYIGYRENHLQNIILSSAKETILDIDMEQSATNLGAIIVLAVIPAQAINDMSTLSVKQFSVDETNRYAGSRADPARMASNYAGVQGADDSRNDVVIRGNSPGGVLWRVEGVDIFNPNHFNIPGTGGGSVSILNNKILSNSDFFTGAFPAEYGNSVSGVFDLNLRHGNNEKMEFSGQFGFLGTELFAEGPLSKRKDGDNSLRPSFLISYRYSTLALFSFLGINVGTNATPHYQDAAFNLNFPLKNNANISLFGMGGKSNIDILISTQKKTDEIDIYAQNDRDQYFGSQMGMTGLSFKKSFNSNSFMSLTVAAQGDLVSAHHKYINRHINTADSSWVIDSIYPMLDYDFNESKISTSWFIKHKFSSRVVLKAGFTNDYYMFSYIDSLRNIDTTSANFNQWNVRWNSNSNADMFQPYVQLKIKPTDKISINVGLHSQYYSLSHSFSAIEPRAGLKFDLPWRQTIAAAVGFHRMAQPSYIYFYGIPRADRSVYEYNKNIDFTRSIHYGLSYMKVFRWYTRVLVEAYYQSIYNAPVEKKISSFSLLNSGSGFSRFFPDSLQNTGTGENYGLEFTLEKAFSHHYFFLLTASYFQSYYRGSDLIKRHTDFDGNYCANFLGAKEFTVRKKNIFQVGGKLTTAGGRRYGPVDSLASQQQKDVIFIDSARNTQQFAPYFRFDLKLNYKINRKHVSHEIGIDIVNVFDTKNILKLTYAPSLNSSVSPIRQEYQLGRLPLFYYKIDF